jgi:hypothetical protein
MSIEQTAVQLAEVERDIRALVRRHTELLTRLIEESQQLLAGTDYRTAEHPETTQRFRIPSFMGRPKKDAGMSTVLLSASGALSQLSQPTPCPESCCMPMRHQHYADGTVIQERETGNGRERSHRRP